MKYGQSCSTCHYFYQNDGDSAYVENYKKDCKIFVKHNLPFECRQSIHKIVDVDIDEWCAEYVKCGGLIQIENELSNIRAAKQYRRNYENKYAE